MNNHSALISQLRSHPWVADALCADGGAAVALTSDGIAALLRVGRAALLADMNAFLLERHHQAPGHWRLFETLPAMDATAIDALLRAPLPREAFVLHEAATEDGCELQLRIPLDLVYFCGHFPQAPVVPGVVQIGWALALAAPRLGTPPRCLSMEALKFQQLIRPGNRAKLVLAS